MSFPRFRPLARWIPLIGLSMALLGGASLPAFSQTNPLTDTFADTFDGATLNTTLWTPMSLSFNHAGSVAVSGGAATISNDVNDPRVGDSRFGLMSNAVFGPTANIEATLDTWSGVNAIIRLQGRNGAFVEWAIDSNADTPLHVWRSYPDNANSNLQWNGGAGITTPFTFGINRDGGTLKFYTVSNGTRTDQVTLPVGSLGDTYRVFLYGFAGSETTWSDVNASGASDIGTITGTVTRSSDSSPVAGARVSTGDTLFQPVITDAQGKFTMSLPTGTYTLTSSSLGTQPATQTANVVAGKTADASLTLSSTADAPIYDDFVGSALDTSKWTPVTLEGQGDPVITIQNSEAVLAGSDIDVFRRHGLMSTSAFSKTWSVMRFKLDPNPDNDPNWHPFIDLWDGNGIPNWNTQPHVEVEFRSDINRLQFNGGRAPFVSGEADQMMFYPFDTSKLPAILTIVRTGNTYDYYIRGNGDTTDQLAFSETTGNLTTDHRIAIYTFTPAGNPVPHNTSTFDYVAASNPVAGPVGLTGRVLGTGGQPLPFAGVFASQDGKIIKTVSTDANGTYTLSVLPGDYSISAVAYGYDRAAAQTISLQNGQSRDLSLTASTLFPLTTYDDFSGTSLDPTKWTTASEEGGQIGAADVTGGELVLTGAGGRWGAKTTSKLPAAGSVSEAVVNSVDNFGPGAVNAIMQLYTGDGGFNGFIEYGIETLAANGMPLLHIWGPESGDFAAPAPTDFPLTLTAVRHGNDLDFYANHQWFDSVTTQRLQGDNSVFLYGYGASVPHFDSLSVSSGNVTPPTGLKGDVNEDGKIGVPDAVLALQYSVGLFTPSDEATRRMKLADVNNDGSVKVADVILILQYAIGIITKFPGQ